MIDVLIAGGGYVGLSLAVSIKKAAPHLAVTLIDGAPEDAWKKDERASAIIAAAAQMLDVLGIWSEIEPEAEPIKRMVITDSKTADPVRPVFLTFDERRRRRAALCPYGAERGAWSARCARQPRDLGVDIRQSTISEGFQERRSCGLRHAVERRRARGAAAGRLRRRALEAARCRRHQDGGFRLWPVRHRHHRRARAPA